MAAATGEEATVAKEAFCNKEEIGAHSDLSAELAHLASEFKGQCKVIDSTGKFVKTVKLHPENLDIVFNFKITGNYYCWYVVCLIICPTLHVEKRVEIWERSKLTVMHPF